MKPLTWDDAEAAGLALLQAHPEMDPLKTRLTDIHKWVAELPEFQDEPDAAPESKLEAIQMAWYEEWQEKQDRWEIEKLRN